MTRTKAWSILFIAAAAAVGLLGILLVGGPAERTPAPAPFVRSSEAPALDALPVPPRARDEGLPSDLPPIRSDSALGGKLPAAPSPTEELVGTVPGARLDGATVRRLHGDQPLTEDHPKVAAAIQIQERNTDWLMAHPAVVGTAIGLNDKGELALTVLTRVDGATDIPAVIDGLPVVLWRTGEISARNRTITQDDVRARTHTKGLSGTAWYTRPVPIGVSTGHPAITAGTIGCRLKDQPGNVYALSNNHVYANENQAAIGDNVLQPGAYDGGINPTHSIGTLNKYVTIVFKRTASNKVDAAIALSNTDNLGKGTPSIGYGVPSSTTTVGALSMGVRKVGRTTDQTDGTISGINATVVVRYDRGLARFLGQLLITPGSFSAGGDSGSLIVTQSGSNPVGLLFAGSSTTTIANKISDVLSGFPTLTLTVDGN